MTNYQRWLLFMKDVPSPEPYISFGFYYMIAASLQRRVWCGPRHCPLFPNQYLILVGDPGIGKGLVIRPIAEILKTHKLHNPNDKSQTKADESVITSVDPALIEALAAANYANATGNNGVQTNKKIKLEKPLVIPVAADATTYEALVHDMSKAMRFIKYKEWDVKLDKHKVSIYTHSSLCFVLEEISSLFRKKTEDIVNFLNRAYDCGDYEYKTKTQGDDLIKHCCLSFLGGTQLSFIERTFNNQILNEGYSSRCWMIYASTNRFNTLKRPELSTEQEDAVKHIIEHIKKLTELYGPVLFTTEAEEWMENWWKNINPTSKPNNSPKLVAYYARKDIHLKKLAMAMHFAEDADKSEDGYPARPIELVTVQAAMAMLDKAEKVMHYALNFDGENPLAIVGKKILQFIRKNGCQSTNELLIEFWDDVGKIQLEDILTHLCLMKKICLAEGVSPKPNKWELLDKTNGEQNK